VLVAGADSRDGAPVQVRLARGWLAEGGDAEVGRHGESVMLGSDTPAASSDNYEVIFGGSCCLGVCCHAWKLHIHVLFGTHVLFGVHAAALPRNLTRVSCIRRILWSASSARWQKQAVPSSFIQTSRCSALVEMSLHVPVIEHGKPLAEEVRLD